MNIRLLAGAVALALIGILLLLFPRWILKGIHDRYRSEECWEEPWDQDLQKVQVGGLLSLAAAFLLFLLYFIIQ